MLDAVVQKLPVGICLFDKAKKLVLANPVFKETFGLSEEEAAPGTPYIDVFEKVIAHVQSDLAREVFLDGALWESAQPPEVWALKDNRHVTVQRQSTPDGWMFTFINVTAQKNSEAVLLQRLAAIEATREGIALIGGDGLIRYLNPAAAKIWGDLDLRNIHHLKWASIYPETLPLAAAWDKRLEFFNGEGQKRVHEVVFTPLEGGGAVVVFRDVSEPEAMRQRTQELQSLLVKAQRQEAAHHLAAGIAHDFNNLLSAINCSAALILMNENASKEGKEHAGRIASAGAQAARLVNRILEFGASTDSDRTFEISTAIEEMRPVLEASMPSNIVLDLQLPQQMILVPGNPDDLSHAILNMGFNARDAIEHEDGRITIAVEPFSYPPEGERVEQLQLSPGLYVKISVEDNGCGMPDDVLAQAFDPYFTTKGSKGTGLGLAVLSMQLKALSGALSVSTEVGVGTKICLYWPCCPPEEPKPKLTTHDGSAILSGITILIVDDDERVANVLAEYLTKFGADVVACTSPHEALAAVQDDPSLWSVLITDYDMPDLSGSELSEAVAKIAPDVSIFMVTALAKRLSDTRLAARQIKGILPKPLDFDYLLQEIVRASNEN